MKFIKFKKNKLYSYRDAINVIYNNELYLKRKISSLKATICFTGFVIFYYVLDKKK